MSPAYLLDRERFAEWLRERAAKGAPVGRPMDAAECPLACYMTARDATLTAVRVGRHDWRAWRGVRFCASGALPAWAYLFARKIDARRDAGLVSAAVALEVLADVPS